MTARKMIEITPSVDNETWEVTFACQSIGVIKLVRDEGPSFAKWLTGQTEWYGIEIDGKPLQAVSALEDAIDFLVRKYLAGEMVFNVT